MLLALGEDLPEGWRPFLGRCPVVDLLAQSGIRAMLPRHAASSALESLLAQPARAPSTCVLNMKGGADSSDHDD
eukprot:13311062-Alexandrium_andersonii.AAC.1